ncbi:aconitase X catalytic domain-containing protein [Microbacterium sp.]|uniref:aconitase X catalytic domain-containing protein n=1 Tax=Microbacterium sp. TaxID=51671 RepID=UPI002C318FD3|nr:aconitase X catalytic domain-containing protein [Microbacterium sp.]HWK76281.1 aconitase X catalytic domain-containing protein [Microbacterium sp.]
MILTDHERAMAAGEAGEAVAAAMTVLVEYGEIMGAERLVETDNVCGAEIFGKRHSSVLGTTDPSTLFSRFALNSDAPMQVPPVRAHSCQLIGPRDHKLYQLQGLTEQEHREASKSEAYLASLGVSILNTCTPYQVGNNPRRGEHCAWMESSAVIYINSVLGARTNTEGRESAAASMLTGRTPYAGLHITENRRGTDLLRVETEMSSTFDWNVLGYFLGGVLGDSIPVLDGVRGPGPDPVSLKQFGAAAASSGDVELFHIPGVTAEVRTLDEAFGGHTPEQTIAFTQQDFDRTVAELNATATGDDIDFVMIGCPHASLNQLRDVARLLDGRRVSSDVALWVFTPSALRDIAARSGWLETIERAGARVLSDTCPAIGQFVPPGTRRFATDSAKQAHYLPPIAKIEGRFGSTAACIDAAISGRWVG